MFSPDQFHTYSYTINLMYYDTMVLIMKNYFSHQTSELDTSDCKCQADMSSWPDVVLLLTTRCLYQGVHLTWICLTAHVKLTWCSTALCHQMPVVGGTSDLGMSDCTCQAATLHLTVNVKLTWCSNALGTTTDNSKMELFIIWTENGCKLILLFL